MEFSWHLVLSSGSLLLGRLVDLVVVVSRLGLLECWLWHL